MKKNNEKQKDFEEAGNIDRDVIFKVKTSMTLKIDYRKTEKRTFAEWLRYLTPTPPKTTQPTRLSDDVQPIK